MLNTINITRKHSMVKFMIIVKTLKNFFPYEINILKYVLNPFFKKVGYNSLTIQKNVLKKFFYCFNIFVSYKIWN